MDGNTMESKVAQMRQRQGKKLEGNARDVQMVTSQPTRSKSTRSNLPNQAPNRVFPP